MRTFRIVRRVIAVTALVAIVAVAYGFWHSGYRVYAVRTGSMSPNLNPGDAVFVTPDAHVPAVGDVITFRPHAGVNELVTHRVFAVVAGGVRTKGDANATPDAWLVSPSMIAGKVVGSAHRLGYVVVFFQQPLGVAATLTSMAAVYLLWGLFFGSSAAPQSTRETASSRPRYQHRRRRRVPAHRQTPAAGRRWVMTSRRKGRHHIGNAVA